MTFKRRSKRDPSARRDEPSLWPGSVDLNRFVATKFIGPAVLQFGLENGFLDPSDVVRLELMRSVSGEAEEGSAERAIALLLSDDLERVPPLLDEVVDAGIELSVSTPLDIWAYVGLARISAMWDSFDDPWDAIEWLLQTLGYPENYRRFLRYTEAGRGEPTGPKHMKHRLDTFLAHCRSQWGS